MPNLRMKNKRQRKSNVSSDQRVFQPTGKNRFLLHPVMLFGSVWGLCFLLYAMHLSKILIFSTAQISQIVQWIVLPYVFSVFLFQVFYAWSPKKATRTKRPTVQDEDFFIRIEKKLHKWFIVWCLLTIVEVVASGGVPLVWLIVGSSKDYTGWGLPVVHVVLTSLLMVIALSEAGMYILLGGKRRLIIPGLLIIWSFVIISRSLMIIAFLQWGVLWFFLKGARIRTIGKALITVFVVIFVFGYIGDARSGGETFRNLAQPSWNYPHWLPSGFLWVYIYITTPLSNLVNTSMLSAPVNSILFPHTFYLLFPTAVRGMIYGKDAASAMLGDLVIQNFNVSTAYLGPLRDYGYFGIVVFSVFLGVLAAYLWRRQKTFRDGLMYTIIAQCLVLSIFWNFLFYNPLVGQIFWIYFLYRTPRHQWKLLPVNVLRPSVPANRDLLKSRA